MEEWLEFERMLTAELKEDISYFNHVKLSYFSDRYCRRNAEAIVDRARADLRASAANTKKYAAILKKEIENDTIRQ